MNKDKQTKFAEARYNAGYRLASDVAREIFEEIERYLKLKITNAIMCKTISGEEDKEYWQGKLSAFLQISDFIKIELKKKYTESEKENDH